MKSSSSLNLAEIDNQAKAITLGKHFPIKFPLSDSSNLFIILVRKNNIKEGNSRVNN